jgi:hypothetical protein
MKCEIDNAFLFDLFRNRDHRRMVTIERLYRSIIWPRCPDSVPSIPLGPYTEHVVKVFRDAATLNCQRYMFDCDSATPQPRVAVPFGSEQI